MKENSKFYDRLFQSVLRSTVLGQRRSASVPLPRKMEHQPRIPDAAVRVCTYLRARLTFNGTHSSVPTAIYGVLCIWSVAGAIETTLQEPRYDFVGTTAIISRGVSWGSDSPWAYRTFEVSNWFCRATSSRISCASRVTWLLTG